MRVPIRLRRFNFSMEADATTLSQTSIFQLITNQYSRTMRISHMEAEHNKVQDQCKIFNNSMLHRGFKDSSSKSRKSKTKEISIFCRSNVSFMGENKRLLNIHEQKFVELVAFQENTNVFQANTNASLKHLETQVGQPTLAMQN